MSYLKKEFRRIQKKVKAVKDWPVPTLIRDVQAFVGLASYYRRFIADFASIARPLHAMTGKNKKFCWTLETDKSFQKLKEALVSSPILVMPTDSDELVLDTDAFLALLAVFCLRDMVGKKR